MHPLTPKPTPPSMANSLSLEPAHRCFLLSPKAELTHLLCVPQNILHVPLTHCKLTPIIYFSLFSLLLHHEGRSQFWFISVPPHSACI